MNVKCTEPQVSRPRFSQLGKTRITCLVLFVISVILLAGWIIKDRQLRELQSTEPTIEVPYIGRPTLCEMPLVNTAADEPAEDTYFRDDIPFGIEEQKLLHNAAEEFDVPYTLALAVVEKETNYRNIMGDGGRSYGYMQVQLHWWHKLMADIGVTDLLEPAQNFRTGCAVLQFLTNKNGGSITDTLTEYNTGYPGTSPYAVAVLAIRDRLEGAGE